MKFIALCKEDLNKYGKLPFNLLKSIYTFITLLCKNHLEFKFEIAPYMKNIIGHLKYDVGAL
jgi:hypothetical protein